MEHVTKAQIKLIRSLQQKKFRDETGLFVAEGEKCVSELQKTFELVYKIQSTERGADRVQNTDLLATSKEIEQMSGLRAPQGVIGVFRKGTDHDTDEQQTTDELILALDGIQDPGNMGTIIRTCDWFGVRDIFCSRDTADCFNPKVVQATMGALARVRVHYVDLEQESKRMKEDGRRIYGTLLDGQDMYEVISGQQSVVSCQRSVIIMGNEGRGISEAVRKYITHPIRIPSYPKNVETSESLDVSIATAIVLAEFRRMV